MGFPSRPPVPQEVVQRVEKNQAPSNEVTILHLLTHSSRGLGFADGFPSSVEDLLTGH